MVINESPAITLIFVCLQSSKETGRNYFFINAMYWVEKEKKGSVPARPAFRKYTLLKVHLYKRNKQQVIHWQRPCSIHWKDSKSSIWKLSLSLLSCHSAKSCVQLLTQTISIQKAQANESTGRSHREVLIQRQFQEEQIENVCHGWVRRKGRWLTDSESCSLPLDFSTCNFSQ